MRCKAVDIEIGLHEEGVVDVAELKISIIENSQKNGFFDLRVYKIGITERTKFRTIKETIKYLDGYLEEAEDYISTPISFDCGNAKWWDKFALNLRDKR